jgi:hydrophobic/amphiphilic exporter-1 (mainly G- bacteria), HAE1 family
MSESLSGNNNGHNPGSFPMEEQPAPRKGGRGMWLSDLSIGQPVFITMIVAAALFGGIFFFSQMGLDLLPDTSLPVVVVQTIYPGADPQEIERSVTKPIEDEMASVNNVDTIRSNSMDSVSIVVVAFKMDADVKTAADDVRNKVNAIRNDLPADVREPVIDRLDPNASGIIGFAVSDPSGKRSPEQLRTLMDDTLKQRIEKVSGVAAVDVTGGYVSEVHVDLKTERLNAYGISPLQLIQAVKGENIDIPSGRVKDNRSEQLVRTAGQVKSVEQLREIAIPSTRGAAVKVRDIATVTEDHQEVRAISRLNGKESVVGEVRKMSGTNTVQVTDGVKVELERIKKDYPDLTFATTYDQSIFTRDSVSDVELSIILGGLLAALVVFVFFRNWQNTLITVAGLPVILFGTFMFMYVMGITLNMVTLMALSLSVGMLIDDAIVVRENIFRHMERGETPREAASRGAGEIGLAVAAVTSTIVAVFLPIAFAGGLVGKFSSHFGMTVVAAILISLFEAFTFGPMLASRFARPMEVEGTEREGSDRFFKALGALDHGYRRLLAWSLHHRMAVVGIGLAGLLASFASIPLMNTSLFPSTDQGEVMVALELKPGSRLEDTDRTAMAIEKLALADAEVDRVFSTIGSNNGAANKAEIHVMMKGRGRCDDFIRRFRPQIDGTVLGGTSVTMQKRALDQLLGGGLAAGAIRSRPVQFSVEGPDIDQLDSVSAELVSKLKQVPGLVDVDRSLKSGQPEQVISLDRNRANDLGVSTGQLGMMMRVLINGEKAGVLRGTDKDIDVYVRLSEGDRSDAAQLLAMPVLTAKGAQVPLSNVAKVASSTQANQIDRENRQRQVVVGGGYVGRDLGKVFAASQKAVDSMQLPNGVTIRVMGQAKYMSDAFSTLKVVLAFSVVLVFMILASQFGSFVHPLTIMLALPFSVVGALLSLFLGGFSLDIMGMIGVILLMGLVTKNSILLVEFINQLRQRGLSMGEAVMQAGQTRLRPILMTTLSMIFGMLPIAIGFGAGGEFRQPMGVSVIGGIITSTVLTLIVVPVAYTLVDDATGLVAKRRGKSDRTDEAKRGQPAESPVS